MDDIKTIIEKIYQDYNPTKISNIPNLLEKYKGSEGEMLSKMADKYSIRLQDYIKIDYLWVVTEILKKYEPINVASASTLLANNKKHEDELLTQLCNKYDSKLNDIIISLYISNPPSLVQNIEKPFQKNLIPSSKIDGKVQKPKKANKILTYVIPVIIIFVIILTLALSGVFSHRKKTDSSNVSNSSSIDNTFNSNPNTSTTNNNNENSVSKNESPHSVTNNTNTPGKYPQASDRLLTDSDISGLDKHELLIMKNEIYARYGYIFHYDKFCIEYFSNQPWYHGQVNDVSTKLTNIENLNIALIIKYENR